MTMTCDEFLEGVKGLITVPSNQALYTDEAMLLLADFENRSTVTPLIDSVGQGYFQTRTQRFQLQPNQIYYPIPSRAVGRKLQAVVLTDDSGGYWSFPMVGIERGFMIRFGEIPFGFRFEGDRIALINAPTAVSDFGLTFFYMATPGKLVKNDQAAIIDSIVGNDITLLNVPSTFQIGRRIDLINGEPGNWFKGMSLKIDNIAANTITTVETPPDDLTEGDWMALTGESPVIQLPEELVPLLMNATCRRILGGISDFEGKADVEKEIEEQKETVARLIQPRINNQPIRLVNPYGPGRKGFRRNWSAYFRD